MNRSSKVLSLTATTTLLLSAVVAPAQLSANTSMLCQDPGCVLPVSKPAPPPAPSAAPVVEEAKEGGFPILGALLGAAAIAGGIILLTDGDDEPNSP